MARRSAVLTEKEKALLDEQRFLTIDYMLYQESSYLNILSVNAAVSPLIGLFGTVWGLMHSFMSISERQTADIVTTAPGIAEALITTLAGLMVAIPMLIMFNFLQTRVAHLEHQICRVSDRVAVLTQIFLGNLKDEHEVSSTSTQTPRTTHAS
jgi:biopolymer transport protein ExbB/TolQ